MVFNQEILTARLERIIGLIYRVFPPEEYKRDNYNELLEQLSPLLPVYFDRALRS